MAKSNENKKIGAIFICIIALMLILYGLLHIFLGYFGEKDTAIITSVRRQGGERNEAIPNRYTLVISYRFTLPDSKDIDGFSYKVGSPVYVKVSDTTPSFVSIRYLKAFPYLNALEIDSGFKAGNLVIVGFGFLMISLLKSNRKQ